MTILCWRSLAEMRGDAQRVRDVIRHFPSDGTLAPGDSPPVAPWDTASASAATGAIAASKAQPRTQSGAGQGTATPVLITRDPAADWMRYNPTYVAGEQSADDVPATYGAPFPAGEQPALSPLPGEYVYSEICAMGDELCDTSFGAAATPVASYSGLTTKHEVYRSDEAAARASGWRGGVSSMPALAPGYTALEPDHMAYGAVLMSSGAVEAHGQAARISEVEKLSESDNYI